MTNRLTSDTPHDQDGPRAPPKADRTRLELFRRIYIGRCDQIISLSRSQFAYLADEMIKDFKHSVNHEGHNSSHLLTMDKSAATHRTVSAHLLALFYRSIDDRISPGERSHSLHHLKTAFQLLDKVRETPSLADEYDEMLKGKRGLEEVEEQQRKKQLEDDRKQSQTEKLRRLELDPRNTQGEESRQLTLNRKRKEHDPAKQSNGDDDRTERLSVQDTGSAMHHVNVEETARFGAATDSTNDVEKKSGKRNGDEIAHSDIPDMNRTMKKNKMDSEADSNRRDRPQPPPKPFTVIRTVFFLGDYSNPARQVYCKSGAIHPRSVCTLRYDSGYSISGAGTVMDDETAIELQARLHRWDPYWKITKEVGRASNFDSRGNPVMHSWKTASCFETSGYVRKEGNPLSCVEMVVDLSKEEDLGVVWHAPGTAGLKTGDRRLLLRSLPLVREPKERKDKCDMHTWPKGTFVQLEQFGRRKLLSIQQRNQQSHDSDLWKGQSAPLDLTSHVDPREPFAVKICTYHPVKRPSLDQIISNGTKVVKEFLDEATGQLEPFEGKVVGYDPEYKLYRILYSDGDGEEIARSDIEKIMVGKPNRHLSGSYGINLAICEYASADDLVRQIATTMAKISLEDAKIFAEEYAAKQHVTIDLDDDDINADDEVSLNFSLACPISQRRIDRPVRGKNCTHIQCFDLQPFLQSNQHVTGSRWRCGVCEQFLSVGDLLECGLYKAMLREAGSDDVCAVYQTRTGSWKLNDGGKEKLNGKNESTITEINKTGKVKRVIELD